MKAFAVVTACDSQYPQHSSVMLRSLIENNPKIPFEIFLLVPSDFHETAETMIQESMPKDGTYSIAFIKLCPKGLIELKTSDWISHATYYRLMMPELLPNISRALYLDSDLVIIGDISPLLHLDISDYPLAAALDGLLDARLEFKEQINLGRSVPYFNAGVLLLNLDRWRSENIGGRALNFAAKNPQWIVYWDQCALNNVIRGDFLVLPKEWNYQKAHVDLDLLSGNLSEGAQRAKIVHFTSALKPWDFNSVHPLKHLYWKYLRNTVWKDRVEPDRILRMTLLKGLLLLYFPRLAPKVRRMYALIKAASRRLPG